MTDILKNTASLMAAGAALGYQVGSDLRDRLNQQDEQRALHEWHIYAQQLTEELRQTKANLATANDKVVHRDEAFKELSDIAKEYAVKADLARLEVEEKNGKIHNLVEKQKQMQLEQNRLKAEQEKSNEVQEAIIRNVKLLRAEVAKLKNFCEHSSAQAAAYDELFKLLCNEISRGDIVEDFNNLNPADIEKAYQTAYLEFRGTGRILYLPEKIVAEVAAKLAKKNPRVI